MTLQSVSDDFNRSNRWLGATGESWVARATTYPDIVSNQISTGPTNTAVAIHTSSFSGTQTSQITLKTIGSATSKAACYVAVENNGTTPGNTYDWDTGAAAYRWLAQTSNFKLQIHTAGGGWTTITGTTYTATPAANDVMKATWDPATGIVKGYLNGVERATYTDPAPISASNTRIGFMLQSGSVAEDFSGSWNVTASPPFSWHEWTGGTAPSGSEITLTVDGEWNGSTTPDLNDYGTAEVATDTSSLPLVQPIWSDLVRDGYGINCHYKFSGDNTNVHQYTAQLTAYVLDLGCGWIRDRMTQPGSVYNTQFAEFANLNAGGVGIHLTLSEGTSPGWEQTTGAQITKYWTDIAARPTWKWSTAGPNEPDSLQFPVANWPTKLRDHQKLLFDARAVAGMTAVPLASPALKDGADIVEQSYIDIGATNLWQYCDVADYHRYPMGKNTPDPTYDAGTLGRTPSYLQDTRIGWARAAYKTNTTTCTEGGYNTDLAVTVGGEHLPDDVHSIYSERTLFELLNRGVKRWFQYELMDDPDPGHTGAESHRGLVFTPQLNPATWSVKPSFTRMKALMTLVRDIGGGFDPVTNPFTPAKVRLQLTCADAQFRSVVVGKRSGQNILFYWLDKALWNTATNVRINDVPAALTVQTTATTLNLTATGTVQSVVLT